MAEVFSYTYRARNVLTRKKAVQKYWGLLFYDKEAATCSHKCRNDKRTLLYKSITLIFPHR